MRFPFISHMKRCFTYHSCFAVVVQFPFQKNLKEATVNIVMIMEVATPFFVVLDVSKAEVSTFIKNPD